MKLKSSVWRWAAVGAVLVGAGFLILNSDLSAVWREPTEVVVERLRSLGPWTIAVSLILLVIETMVPPIPAAPILVANAVIYGVWVGVVISWAGSVLGALVNFWIARRFGRSYVERRMKAEHLERVDQISRENGFQILLLARMFPLTPLDLLSYMAGLSSISFAKYFWATAIGLVPSVTVYTLLSHDLYRPQEYLWRVAPVVGVVVIAYVMYRYRARAAKFVEYLQERLRRPRHD